MGWLFYGFRTYDAAVGRWGQIDPLAEKYYGWSPYNYVMDSPLVFVDPDGRSVNNEYDKNGNKISNLGGDYVHFFHLSNGDTRVIDVMAGGSNIIKGGERLIRGYAHRDKNTNYWDIFQEFRTGTGPENSLIYGKDHPMNKELMDSYQMFLGIKEFNARADGKTKSGPTRGTFGLLGYVRAGGNMTEQMVGKSNISIYELGDNRLVLITDSKSRSSWTLWPFDGDEVNTPRTNGSGPPQSNTNQTYMFILSSKELQDVYEKYETENDTFD